MFDYHAIAPELILGVTLVRVVAVDLVLSDRLKYLAGVTALVGLVAAAFPLLTLATCGELSSCTDTGVRSLFGGSYVVDDFALVLKGLFIVVGVITLLLSVGYIESDDYYQGEFYFLVLASITGAVIMASSSDFPVTIPFDPVIAIQLGITRSEIGVVPEDILWPEERVTLEDMIASFTIHGAYANFLDEETGSLEVGKQADIVVLDQNLFEIPVTKIAKTKVLMTLVDGEVVFGE